MKGFVHFVDIEAFYSGMAKSLTIYTKKPKCEHEFCRILKVEGYIKTRHNKSHENTKPIKDKKRGRLRSRKTRSNKK